MLAFGLGLGLPFGKGGPSGPSISITAISIAEDAIIGDPIGVLSVANGDGVYTFSITADPDSKFALNGDGVTLELSATVDFETATTHTVTVEADNGVDDPIVRVITVTVTNVFEAASLGALSLDVDDIDENSAEDTVVGAVVGKTTGSALSLIDDAGGRFKLTGTNIVAGATVTDYEAATSYNITIRETLADSANSPRDTVIPITINDVDEIAPVLSNAIDTETGATTASLSVDTDEGNGTLYWVVSTSATSPTAAQVAAGNDHTGSAAVDSGSQAVSGTGTQTVSGGATGLTAETTYFAHFMHADALGNQSAVLSAGGFTTEVAPGSGALTLLGADDGLAIAFDDDAYFGTTGFYGSAAVVGGGTQDGYDDPPDLTAASLLTYTSPSLKMTMGPDGVLRYGAHNLYLNSATPANQSITVVSGATYAVTITGTVSVTASGAATGTWTAGTQTFTAATTTLTFGSTSGAGTVHVRRTPSDSTYLATAGTIRYSLPYQWTSAGVLEGILVEEARTNLYTYSQEFDNAAWNKGAIASISANSVTAPDGTTTADTITSTGTNTTCHVNRTATPLSTTAAYTATFYVKAGTFTYFCMSFFDNTDGNRQWFNLSNGTLGSTAVIGAGLTSPSASITALPDGWYKCTMTAVTKAVNALNNFYSMTDADASLTATSGKNAYLWGAQLEAGAFPTSYIETFASTVTRAADNISLGTAAFPHSNATSTLFAEVGATVAGTDRYPAQLWQSSTLYYGHCILTTNMTNLIARDGGTRDIAGDGITSSNTNKVAAAVATNDLALVTNGATADLNGTWTPITATQIRIGQNSNGGAFANGLIRKIMYLPTRKTNAELQTITGA